MRSCAWRKSKGRILANKLSIENIHAGYGAVRVLSDVNISVGHGETVALLGTNGNGKTTLLRSVMGQVRPTAGRITAEIDGKSFDLIGRTTQEIVGLGISLVAEGRRLFPRLTVEENLLLGAFPARARAKVADHRAFCFDLFPRLKERRTQLAGSMSGGEQQMLAIARGLMSKPKILMFDELSLGLSPLLVLNLFEVLRKLKQEGYTMLLVEQNVQMALAVSDYAYVMNTGRIETEGEAKQVRNMENVRKSYLGL